MKIEYKNNEKCLFENLPLGTVFQIKADVSIFMKVTRNPAKNWNAVYLSDEHGCHDSLFCNIPHDELCYVLNAKLVID